MYGHCHAVSVVTVNPQWPEPIQHDDVAYLVCSLVCAMVCRSSTAFVHTAAATFQLSGQHFIHQGNILGVVALFEFAMYLALPTTSLPLPVPALGPPLSADTKPLAASRLADPTET